MKITRKILENIIKEEIMNVLYEGKVEDKLKSALPTILQNDTAKKIFDITKSAVKDKKVSVNDFISVTKGLEQAVKNGEDAANIAVNDPTALQKAGLDIFIGDITQNLSAPTDSLKKGRAAIDDMHNQGAVGHGAFDYGRTYGIQLRISL